MGGEVGELPKLPGGEAGSSTTRRCLTARENIESFIISSTNGCVVWLDAGHEKSEIVLG